MGQCWLFDLASENQISPKFVSRKEVEAWQSCEWLTEDTQVSCERPERLILQFKEGPWRREPADKLCFHRVKLGESHSEVQSC